MLDTGLSRLGTASHGNFSEYIPLGTLEGDQGSPKVAMEDATM